MPRKQQGKGRVAKKTQILERLFLDCLRKGDFTVEKEEVAKAADEFSFVNKFDAVKVDKSSLYPDIMRRGSGYFLLHLGNGRHMFYPNISLAYRVPELIPEEDSRDWDYVPSLLNDTDTSESNILSVAYNQLIFHDFLYQDRTANPKLYLARRTGFTGQYTINGTPIETDNVQMEMDLILEYGGDVTVVEAKNVKTMQRFHNDFNVYQLFHPYLKFDQSRRDGKLDIRRIRCCYLQRHKEKRGRQRSILRLYLYRFHDHELTSMELIRRQEYILERTSPV